MTMTVDPELGPVKLCPGCGEWWPMDAEFFSHRNLASPIELFRSVCRACDWERRERRRAQNREAQRRHRERVAA